MRYGSNFELITLGRLTLLDPAGVAVESLATRRRKLSLLAVLALAKRPLSRDSLAEMFWGDHPDDRARHALSDALSHLRRTLGRQSITLRHADVELSENAPLSVDAIALARAVEGKRYSAAVALYGGEFLPQLYVGESAELEHWADAERERLKRLFVRACMEECAALARDGRWSECATVAARWTEAAPLSADAGLMLVQALSGSGRRDAAGEALAACERITARLTRELGEPPDARLVARAKALRAHLSGPGPTSDAAPPPSRADTSSAPPLPPKEPERVPFSARPYSDVVDEAMPRPLQRAGALDAMRARARRSLIGALTIALAAAAVWGRHWVSSAAPTSVPGSANVVAVLPFRIVAAESSLAYLREGVPELLSSKLTGEIGPRSVDPATLLSAWRRAGGSERRDLSHDDALATAARVGAGQLLVGSVIGTPERVVLDASLLAVADTRLRGNVTVRGPIDSLPGLVDRLVAGLLATDAGEADRRLADLTSTSLPALKAYLAGRAAHRRGRNAEAASEFHRALELDSAFALAALGVAMAGDWPLIGKSERLRRNLQQAWALRHRLNARDQTMLVAYVGEPYPARRSGREELADWERAVHVAPDSPEAWYEFGDRIFHLGSPLGVADWERRANAAFAHAILLDSSQAHAHAHRVELAVRAGDTVATRENLARFEAHAGTSAAADYVRWRAWTALGDTAALTELRSRFGGMTIASLERIIGMAQIEGVGLEDARRAAGDLYIRATTTPALLIALSAAQRLAVNGGRPIEANALTRQLRTLEPLPAGVINDVYSSWHFAVLDAVFAEGDAAAARLAASELMGRVSEPPRGGAALRARRNADLCTLELWRLSRGATTTGPATIRQLRAASSASDSISHLEGDPTLCATMLEAWHQASIRHPQAAAARTRLDSLLATWPVTFGVTFGNLVLARLHEAAGDFHGALAALRRRPIYWTGGTRYLATFLREEGRLAALLGDQDGARRAYTHYLALRADPEPTVREQAERVRQELSRLRREPR